MVSVRPVAPADFEQLHPLLHWHDPTLTKDAWQRIFDYTWAHNNPHCGYGLFDRDEAVGFIGFIFCERSLAYQSASSKPFKFCNLTTWVVKPQYRSHSLSLMMPVMRMKDYTVTDLSASDDVIEVSKRLGFKILDEAVTVLLPYGWSAYRRKTYYDRPYRELAVALNNAILLGKNTTEISLPPVEQKIFNDHRRYAHCHQLVLKLGKDCCHVAYTLNHEAQLSYSHIHFISDRTLFEQHQQIIRQQIIRQSGLPLIVIDSRLTASAKLPFSYRLPLSSPRIYRSSQLVPAQIDNLYSELVLLEFGTADSLALGWREKALSLCLAPFEKRGKKRTEGGPKKRDKSAQDSSISNATQPL